MSPPQAAFPVYPSSTPISFPSYCRLAAPCDSTFQALVTVTVIVWLMCGSYSRLHEDRDAVFLSFVSSHAESVQ